MSFELYRGLYSSIHYSTPKWVSAFSSFNSPWVLKKTRGVWIVSGVDHKLLKIKIE